MATKSETQTEATSKEDERRRGGDRRAGKTRVVIVDGHTLFRRGVRQILELENDIEVVGEAGSGRDALSTIQELTPDVVLMDLGLPAPNGIETTQRLKRELPHTGVIVLASNDDEDQLFDAIKAGAAAYVLKDIDPTDLIAIIRRVRSGEYLINDKVFAKPAVASRVLKEFRELAVYGVGGAADLRAALTPRGRDPGQHRPGHDEQAGGLRAGHQRADREEPHELHPAQALGQRPHPGRGVRHAPGLDQDPRGLNPGRHHWHEGRSPERPSCLPAASPVAAVREFHWGFAGARRSVAPRRHGYPRRPSSEGIGVLAPVPGSPPPVPREPLRKGRLSCVDGPQTC